MLKSLTAFFGNSSRTSTRQPHIIPPEKHRLTPHQISKGAQQVIEILGQHGYQAYLVGGCVRDLLLGLKPKDFDVATDATPEQVNELFHRARVIGRRFRIAHVRMGPEVIEVTTFRSDRPDNQATHQTSEGMLLSDNIFGTIDQDAARRDFTVNALYYHPQDNTIYDYADGQVDIERRRIVIIGDAETRFREDPVRMLRAARFAAKLGFKIDPATAEPIKRLASLIADVPSARLFDESLKLLMNGHALSTFHLLCEHRLLGVIFPETAAQLAGDDEVLNFLEQALINTDQRIRTNKRVTPAFIFAALLWPQVNRFHKELIQQGESPQLAMQQAANSAITIQINRIAIPRRFTQVMREIWDMQLRLPNRNGRKAQRLLENRRFRAGYDFLLLREQADEIEKGLGDWWTHYQEGDEQRRQKLVDSLNSGRSGSSQRRKRRRRKPGNSSSSSHD